MHRTLLSILEDINRVENARKLLVSLRIVTEGNIKKQVGKVSLNATDACKLGKFSLIHGLWHTPVCEPGT